MEHEPLHTRLKEAVVRAGNQSKFAKAVGTSQQLVSYWLKNGRPLPGEFVLAAEAAGLGSRHFLRPDLYPMEVESDPSAGTRHSSPGTPGNLTDQQEKAA